MVLQSFVRITYHVQFVLFTTKSTLRLRSGQAPGTKVSDDYRKGEKSFAPTINLRVLRGEIIFTVNPEEPFKYAAIDANFFR